MNIAAPTAQYGGPTGTEHLLVEVCPRARRENLVKDMKRWTRSDKTRLFAVAGQPVPALPAHGRLLTAAQPEACGTKALALARSHLRDDKAHVREDRRACRGASRARSSSPSQRADNLWGDVLSGEIATTEGVRFPGAQRV
jgi:hypothetical protein